MPVGGCPNLLCLREQPWSPDAVTFFKGFIIFIERDFDLLFKGNFELIIFEFIFSMFNKGREGTSTTCIYLLSLSLPCVSYSNRTWTALFLVG